MVNSIVNSNMLSTRKKKQQIKKVFNQFSESDSGYMIGQSNMKPKQVEKLIW